MISDQGVAPTYPPGSILSARADLGSNAFLYCFYQDVDGVIARIFPNRFQPNPYISSRSVVLSGPRMTAKIRFDKPGHETISCFASETDIHLPPKLMEKDLAKLTVDSLDEIDGIFQSSHQNISTSRIEINVQ